MKNSDLIAPAALLLLLFFSDKRKSKTGSATAEYLVTGFVENGIFQAGINVIDDTDQNSWYVLQVNPGSGNTDEYSESGYNFLLEEDTDVFWVLVTKNGEVIEQLIYDSSGAMI